MKQGITKWLLAVTGIMVFNSCGGGGGGSSEADETLHEGVLAHANGVSNSYGWPVGSESENLVYLVSFSLGDGSVSSDGIERGEVSEIFCLILNAELMLTNSCYAQADSYTYRAASGEFVLSGLSIFSSGSKCNLTMSLSSTSDTTMSAKLLENPTIKAYTTSSDVTYTIKLPELSGYPLTIELEGHVNDDEVVDPDDDFAVDPDDDFAVDPEVDAGILAM